MEPIEEGLAVTICFLLLDNYVTLRSPVDKCIKPLDFLDRLAAQMDAVEPTPVKENSDLSDFFHQVGQKASILVCHKTMSLTDFKLQLHLYRAKVHLMKRGYRPSKREIKMALGIDRDSAEAIKMRNPKPNHNLNHNPI